MKLSNKILIGFFGFIFLYLTAAFAELKLTGTSNVVDESNSKAETVDLSRITYVVIKGVDKTVNVIGSDRSQLEVRSFSGDLLKNLKYKVSGDTLTLSDFESEEIKAIKITVFVSETGLQGITVNHATAVVEGLQQPLLKISQSAGHIHMSRSTVGKIQMNVSERSQLNISDTELDTLSAEIDQSQVYIYGRVGVLQGGMQNHSIMQLNDLQEIQLKKDESSRLNVY